MPSPTTGSMAAVSTEEKDKPPETTKHDELEPAPWPPDVAARYERLNKLGESMFGDVYKAWDRTSKRLVAVKRLSGRADDRFVQTALHDFAREVMSLAACRGHRSVVKIVATHADTSRRDGDCFLVTRYAGPLNLHQYLALRLQQERPFTEAEVRHAMRQLLSGAKRAHLAGVLHRDMAPENVVVDRTKWGRMVYRICGFGMSERAASREAGKEKDGDGGAALASTSPYRAPELFLGSELYDDRVDTWGLGCIMAELIAGAGEPFFGKSQDDVFDKVQEVAGRRGMVLWEGLERVAGRDRAAELRERYAANVGRLREVFPEGVISEHGFEVLAGLLDTNPESRLTAKQALEKPWFRRNGFAGSCFAP